MDVGCIKPFPSVVFRAFTAPVLRRVVMLTLRSNRSFLQEVQQSFCYRFPTLTGVGLVIAAAYIHVEECNP